MNHIEQLESFLKHTPDDSFLRHALALEYIKTGNDAKAREIFDALLENNPGYVGSYYHLARLLERTGTKQEAINTYKRGMEIALQEGDLHTYNELRSAYEQLIF